MIQTIFYREFALAPDSVEFAAAVQAQLGAAHPVQALTPEELSGVIVQIIRCDGENANSNCDSVMREAESQNPSLNTRSLVEVIQQLRTAEGGIFFNEIEYRIRIINMTRGISL